MNAVVVKVVERQRRTAAAASPVAFRLLHALDEVDLRADSGVGRLMRCGRRE
jgi:hypothetical protein